MNPRSWLFPLLLLPLLAACGGRAVNSPYPASERGQNLVYSVFSERPKHLDPARAYADNEYQIIGQIYEQPLQYHYLKRPYTLVPLSAAEVPHPVYYDKAGRRLPDNAPASLVTRSVYEIHVRPGMRYQPHPAFAKDATGLYLYHHLGADALARIHALADFPQTGSREVTAADYVYEIKRLADPHVNSPILGMMAEHIAGLADLAKVLARDARAHPEAPLDLNRYALPGATVVDRYAYRITLTGKYPQFLYWLAMPFFAPIPWEADAFYRQPGLVRKNITLDWQPLGSGPYMMTVNDPNRRMELRRNPYFHGERYPSEGEAGDAALGLLKDAGQPLPRNDGIVFSLDKEAIPVWNKFLQGYYDASGIASDNFDQAVRMKGDDDVELTPALQRKGVRLLTQVAATSQYLGFNMRDPVVGGYSERARKLRQAISIAIDYEEFIAIFMNGRGIAAQGPIPPGIFGFDVGREGINPDVYDWVDGHPRRKPIAAARQLLAEAGYPSGRDARTGAPLVINFDATGGAAGDKAFFDWLRKQFAKLDIQLVVRATDFNRFQDKLEHGDCQLFQFGWNADYPDPENFLFLLYGPNGKMMHHGENAANYDNPAFNRLFERMRNMDNTPERRRLVAQMVRIAQDDAPWVWGLHPKLFGLYHAWYGNAKPNVMANNKLKYVSIDAARRETARQAWNRPAWWPLWLLPLLALALAAPVVFVLRRKDKERGR